jgi:hypothetical protein
MRGEESGDGEGMTSMQVRKRIHHMPLSKLTGSQGCAGVEAVVVSHMILSFMHNTKSLLPALNSLVTFLHCDARWSFPLCHHSPHLS